MLNKVILVGRLCSDPVLKQTQSGIPCCRFRIAVNRPYKKDQEQQADFINCTAWRGTAEFVSRYFSKGKIIILDGSLRNNDYTDSNGVKHYGMDVLVDSVSFGESKQSASGEPAAQQNHQSDVPHFDTVAAPKNNPYVNQSAQPADIGDLGDYEEILSDGEVPF